MYEIDKHRFGSFVAQLRREKGMTQKELAQKLYISDKAVSKWETAVSIPDVALLIPLAKALEVSVTELLECRRLPKEEPMQTEQVEQLLQKAIHYSGKEDARPGLRKRAAVYGACLAVACLELVLLHFFGYPFDGWSVMLQLSVIFGVVFGAYFMLVVTYRLPDYYDHNRIGYVTMYGLKLHLMGLAFNNRNWPHIIRAGQIWSMSWLIGYPAVFFLIHRLLPEVALYPVEMGSLVVMLLSLFVPMYVVGLKYEK